jgi:rhamnosyl/mannosyltransferase
MRVVHVYRTYFPDSQGGLEEVIRQICLSTSVEGVESRVFTLSTHSKPAVVQRDECSVHRFPRTFEIASCGVSVSALAGFRHLVRWADVVHYHFPWPFADVLHLLGQVRRPSVVTYHSDIVRQKRLLRLYRPVMNRFLESVDCIVPTSPNYFATSDVLGRFSEKVEVIPIGVDDASYPTADPALKSALKQQIGEDFFLFVGVLRYYKGLHILLDAVQDTDLPVVIVGAGPVEQELRERVVRQKLDNVCLLGRVDNEQKVALIDLSRAIVFPSYLRSEAFGVTLLEGAMYRKPLISAEIGTGTSYVNIHGKTGLVVPPADARSLREAMQSLQQDSGLARCMGVAARERYQELFTGKLMGRRYARLYEKLSSGETRASKTSVVGETAGCS